jgi:hypothetical protein
LPLDNPSAGLPDKRLIGVEGFETTIKSQGFNFAGRFGYFLSSTLARAQAVLLAAMTKISSLTRTSASA